MKKIVLVLFIFLFGSFVTNAQWNTMFVGLNGTLSLPLGDFSDIASTGYGVSGNFYYTVSENFDVTGSLGFISWNRDAGQLSESVSAEASGTKLTIPILVGGRYYFEGDNLKPFGAAKFGFHIFNSSDYKVTVNNVVLLDEKGETNVNFGFSLGGGAIYEITKTFNFEGALMYNVISGDNSLAHLTIDLGFKIAID